MSESLLKQLLRQSGSKSLSNTAKTLTKTTIAGGTKVETVSAEKLIGEKKLSAGANVFAKSLPFGHASTKGTSNSTTNSSASGSGNSSASSLAQTVLGGSISNFLGMGSIVSGFLGLFGGDSQATATPLVKFTLPGSQNKTMDVSATSRDNTNGAVSDGQVLMASSAHSPGSSAGQVSSEVSSNQTAQPVLTQPAMNSQWFLDNSNEIAKAVKDAMLNSSSINDVISEV